MNDYWSIPRASLAPSSAASSASSSNRSNKSNSNPPTVAKRNGKQQRNGKEQRYAGNVNLMAIHGSNNSNISNGIPSKSISATVPATNTAATAAMLAVAKRGSRSSQGSSDSNNSTRSAASGSLLLTAANLERFAAIHKKQQQNNPKFYLNNIPTVHNAGNGTTMTTTTSTNYNANLVHGHTVDANGQATDDTIIAMHDPNLHFVKTKDLDTVSIASSMHFTMVNGEGGPVKQPKRGLCDRGRQVTVLIISMSTVFLLLIMGMVYALEMRAREMPQS